ISSLSQSYLLIPHKHKDIYMVYLLTLFTGRSSVVFTRTVAETSRLTYLLQSLGFGAISLHGQLSQSQCLGALSRFKSQAKSSCAILVATDIVSRGLDTPSVNIVVNYDLPSDSNTYIHRVGRTARVGKSGQAVTLVSQYDVERFQRLEQVLHQKLTHFPVNKEEAMAYSDRVNEAQRFAAGQMQ
ncbi:P-loop containing nucleoside triphosphate hydrolase protein, partial [Zopfia rhizophila CBS 207.26]